ncbi:MAG: dual serine/threonine-protein kinase/phosphatase [Verrucomicrobiaceae bacterium]|nr:dual serine/threonine-protein kinase/phosphatase [Verrucomicrobiaceae bacterium]
MSSESQPGEIKPGEIKIGEIKAVERRTVERKPAELKVTVGQFSDKGCKTVNQDFHGVCIPKEPLLSSKGVAVAIADGISSSNVSQIASESAVKSFLEDYYCTSEAWSVKTSAQRVLTATNSWLYAQTQQSQYRNDNDRGYVCTFSALVIKSATAHLFHVGDARIYRVVDNALEQLTTDHRIHLSPEQNYLARALGIGSHLEIDYLSLNVEQGDVFVLATDGVYEHVDARFITKTIDDSASDLDNAAQIIVAEALRQGSADNLTVQIVRVDALPNRDAGEIYQQLSQLPLPPLLAARMQFDGYTVLREVHSSHRSHLYLAQDNETQARVIIKIPSIDMRGDATYLESFLMEEWIARRIDDAHVMKAIVPTRKRNFIYVVTEYIEGQTLAQWMIDHPKPDLESVRGIIEQVAKGLRAFHRAEMLHQDLRPENIVIDSAGVMKIIDFGSTSVAGVLEVTAQDQQANVRGTVQYAAPEYFLGESGSPRSDIFSLGVVAYQMLTGKLPYGAEVAKCRTQAAQSKLVYESVRTRDRAIPVWIDGVFKKAVHPNPLKRYGELSEFIYDLRHPRQEFLDKTRAPLIERNPVLFWKVVCIVLLIVILVLVSRGR